MRLRVRTVNPPDSEPRGCALRIEDAKTGELIEGVRALQLRCDGRGALVTLRLDLKDIDLDFEAVSEEKSP